MESIETKNLLVLPNYIIFAEHTYFIECTCYLVFKYLLKTGKIIYVQSVFENEYRPCTWGIRILTIVSSRARSNNNNNNNTVNGTF